jgi:hypothetical protein
VAGPWPSARPGEALLTGSGSFTVNSNGVANPVRRIQLVE